MCILLGLCNLGHPSQKDLVVLLQSLSSPWLQQESAKDWTDVCLYGPFVCIRFAVRSFDGSMPPGQIQRQYGKALSKGMGKLEERPELSVQLTCCFLISHYAKFISLSRQFQS